ncbi:unnamed protein product [Mytilus edulis]|uniref:G-protein coupled receptors family 1 profile domain-containing protein n=1 Tax=Mytilus edulis TaxID=6550 RepID=A0A8S3RFW7_MYTED|nr:unnamed protein product [Mytilus edulis]
MNRNWTCVENISSDQPLERSEYMILPVETVRLIRNICYLGIIPFLVIVGLILNSLCFMLFCKIGKRSSTVIMLFAITVTDVFTLVNGGLNSVFYASQTYEVLLTKDQLRLTVPIYSTYVNALPGKIGNFIIFLISLERLFCVMQPLKIRLYSTKRNSYIAVCVAFILPAVSSIPNLFLYNTEQVYSNITGQLTTVLKATSYGKDKEITNAVYITLEILWRYLPVIGVTVSSSITAMLVLLNAKRRLIMAKDSRKSRPESQTMNRESQVTRMLLIVTAVFVLCQLPNTILRMIINIHPAMTSMRYLNNVYEIAFPITYVMLLINSVVNFIIYYNTSTVYRAKIRQMFNWSTYEKNKSSYSMSNSHTNCTFIPDHTVHTGSNF